MKHSLDISNKCLLKVNQLIPTPRPKYSPNKHIHKHAQRSNCLPSALVSLYSPSEDLLLVLGRIRDQIPATFCNTFKHNVKTLTFARTPLWSVHVHAESLQSSIAARCSFITIALTLPVFTLAVTVDAKGQKDLLRLPNTHTERQLTQVDCSSQIACLIVRKGKVINNAQTAKGQGQRAVRHKESSISHGPFRGEKKPADRLVYKPTIARTWEELCRVKPVGLPECA